MVTSRVRLAAPGEWVLALEGMPCPEADDQDRIEAFERGPPVPERPRGAWHRN
jgi:hypothetical protein